VFTRDGKLVADSGPQDYSQGQVDEFARSVLRTEATFIRQNEDSLEIVGSVTDGQDVIGGFSVEIDSSPISAEIRAMTLRRVREALLLVAVGAIASYLIARYFVRPIKRFAVVAHSIGQGDFTVELEYSRNDEIGDLARSFDNMATQLGRSRAQLEQRTEDLRRTADNLQQTTVSKNYVDNIMNCMLDTLMVVNPDGTIRTANRSACNLLGYAPDELIGSPLVAVAEADDLPDSGLPDSGLPDSGLPASGLMDQIGETSVHHAEVTYLAKDGTRTPMSFSSSPLATANGEVPGIVCVAQDITERKKSEQQIKASLQEKEVLLREIHHRVKNNLQIISSLLNLQSKRIQDEHALNLLRDSQNRVRSMALIHQKLYDSRDLARIDFAGYLRSLASALFSSYGIGSQGISLKLSVDDIRLDINTAVPCGLIINELIANSLKHAFPTGQGEISVDLHPDGDDAVALTVSDNGGGFPEDLDFRKTDSLGLQLVNTLTKQLGGTIELDRSTGTAFKLKFPTSESNRGDQENG
jgi:two-component sensor histidine kinase/HAMP domain-containing protein